MRDIPEPLYYASGPGVDLLVGCPEIRRIRASWKLIYRDIVYFHVGYGIHSSDTEQKKHLYVVAFFFVPDYVPAVFVAAERQGINKLVRDSVRNRVETVLRAVFWRSEIVPKIRLRRRYGHIDRVYRGYDRDYQGDYSEIPCIRNRDLALSLGSYRPDIRFFPFVFYRRNHAPLFSSRKKRPQTMKYLVISEIHPAVPGPAEREEKHIAWDNGIQRNVFQNFEISFIVFLRFYDIRRHAFYFYAELVFDKKLGKI